MGERSVSHLFSPPTEEPEVSNQSIELQPDSVKSSARSSIWFDEFKTWFDEFKTDLRRWGVSHPFSPPTEEPEVLIELQPDSVESSARSSVCLDELETSMLDARFGARFTSMGRFSLKTNTKSGASTVVTKQLLPTVKPNFHGTLFHKTGGQSKTTLFPNVKRLPVVQSSFRSKIKSPVTVKSIRPKPPAVSDLFELQ